MVPPEEDLLGVMEIESLQGQDMWIVGNDAMVGIVESSDLGFFGMSKERASTIIVIGAQSVRMYNSGGDTALRGRFRDLEVDFVNVGCRG